MSFHETHADALKRVGTALASDTRRALLLALMDGVHYPADMAERLGMGRSNVSNHLTCLSNCGMIHAHSEGRHVRYEISSPQLQQALLELSRVVLTVHESDSCLAQIDSSHD
ncbi:HTH-type transcriptional regulator CmtR [Corynebacterium ciconiae DSM 44920]|uniref:ArsR/SmtB family transcription factor n=1 Tax=Corynebacterium ciconiae TaxID=227319 RepID=UPI00039AC48F|nr:metalloregulator ArsR/SmtB family transcription factor [Corynebacterium ciconiae]WKD62270.1 HTH-type transcriptional regulator CmtR [Corynebacterium ciconiae DSM 44920]